MEWFRKRFLTAKEIKQIPIEESVYKDPPQKDVEELLEECLDEAVARRKTGCCGMIFHVYSLYHSDPEAAGKEMVETLKNLGYRVVGDIFVKRELKDDPNDLTAGYWAPNQLPTGPVIYCSFEFEWR
jgi:hypothetical protein